MMRVVILFLMLMRDGMILVLMAGCRMRPVTVILHGEDGRVSTVTFKAACGLGHMHPNHREEGDKAERDASRLGEYHDRRK